MPGCERQNCSKKFQVRVNFSVSTFYTKTFVCGNKLLNFLSQREQLNEVLRLKALE